MGDAEPLGDLRAVAVVAVEQLDYGSRLAERQYAVVEAVDVDGIDHPDLIAEDGGVAGALHHLPRIRKPGDADVVLFEAGLGHLRSSVRDRSRYEECKRPNPVARPAREWDPCRVMRRFSKRGVRDVPADRVVTLTMNPALDAATSVEALTPAIKLRCEEERYDPGGGGLNAARLIARLGGDVLAVHACGGASGQRLARLLEEDGVPQRIVEIEGETRQSLAVTERSTGRQYRFVLPGPRMTAEEGHAALDAVLDEVGGGTLVLASGSLPLGVPADFYGRLATEVADAGGRLVVDTHGDPLRLALEAGVFLIKPNWREFDALAGVERGRGDLGRVQQAQALVADGSAEVVIVTLGDQGALVVTAEGHQEIEPPQVQAESTVGGGDAFAGGLLFALARGAPLDAACRLAVACAAAAVCTPGTAMPLRRDIERIHGGILHDPPESGPRASAPSVPGRPERG